MSETYTATGRRKTAVARAWLTPGTGEITVNGDTFEEYFPTIALQNQVLEPLQESGTKNKFDLKTVTRGGGLNGQADSIKLAVARALLEFDPELRPTLKSAGLLTRDPRAKERKKAGQPGARKNFQFSKR